MNRDIYMPQDLLGISHARYIVEKDPREGCFPKRHWGLKNWKCAVVQDFAHKLSPVWNPKETLESSQPVLNKKLTKKKFWKIIPFIIKVQDNIKMDRERSQQPKGKYN